MLTPEKHLNLEVSVLRISAIMLREVRKKGVVELERLRSVVLKRVGPDGESAFLAATHVVVVEPARLVDSLESLWALLRAAAIKPRMLNIIRGPSRTADLGVPSRLGAHGPLRVHVVLVGDPGAT